MKRASHDKCISSANDTVIIITFVIVASSLLVTVAVDTRSNFSTPFQ